MMSTLGRPRLALSIPSDEIVRFPLGGSDTALGVLPNGRDDAHA